MGYLHLLTLWSSCVDTWISLVPLTFPTLTLTLSVSCFSSPSYFLYLYTIYSSHRLFQTRALTRIFFLGWLLEHIHKVICLLLFTILQSSTSTIQFSHNCMHIKVMQLLCYCYCRHYTLSVLCNKQLTLFLSTLMKFLHLVLNCFC